MRTVDLTPLYRSAIGLDRFAQLFDEAARTEATTNYPPYNVERVDEDKYRITMAVAGFSQDELDIETERDVLKIRGRKGSNDSDRTFLHRGLSMRDFEQRFRLTDHIKVVGATMENGLLNIELIREIPEAMKPRKIVIGGDNLQLVERRVA